MRKMKTIFLVGTLLCSALISLYPHAAHASSSIEHNRRELLKSFASVQWGDKPSVYPLFTAAEEGIHRLRGALARYESSAFTFRKPSCLPTGRMSAFGGFA